MSKEINYIEALESAVLVTGDKNLGLRIIDVSAIIRLNETQSVVNLRSGNTITVNCDLKNHEELMDKWSKSFLLSGLKNETNN